MTASCNILAVICDTKRQHVAGRRQQRGAAAIEAAARAMPAARGFTEALRSASTTGYGLIAEIKKASPSKGMIREDFDPEALAKAYAAAGAACLSVLTDEPYFQGHDSYLATARAAVDLPVLRKDFIIDPYQIAESRALGADCILLILAALEESQAAELEDAAMALGMDVLLEVHDEMEMVQALRLRSPLLGVNNRNLKTMRTDLAVSERLAGLVPADRIMVSESGLATPEDLARLAQIGVRNFLIGESLMRHQDVERATRQLLAQPVPAVKPASEARR